MCWGLVKCGLAPTAGAMNAKELQKFALEGFAAARVPRVDEASLQPFLGLEPKVGSLPSHGHALLLPAS